MKGILLTILLATSTILVSAQTYQDSMAMYQKQYIKELLADAHSPIKPADVKYMHFFPFDASYRVSADFTKTIGGKPFMVNTHSTKQKPFVEYGTITFAIHDTMQTLHVYQSIDLVSGKPTNDYLFIPFNDRTNYDYTYAGGRYIDLSVNDVINNKVLIDFNKCYNPYCAFAEGYSCPIPPDENALHVTIMAGEKLFTKNMGY